MDWNNSSNLMRTFVPRPESAFDFLYNNYNYDQFPGMEVKHTGGIMGEKGHGGLLDKNDKKKRLTSDQLESLERSFHEEIKLDPDRKMKLSRELGLQPRQIAVWFQNRRARWKAKQLELVYDSLKQDFDLVSREKQKLQDEVMKLRSMLREQATRKQVSTGYTEISCEETVESTSVGIRSSSKQPQQMGGGEGSYLFSVEEYSGPAAVSSALWGSVVLPSPNFP